MLCDHNGNIGLSRWNTLFFMHFSLVWTKPKFQELPVKGTEQFNMIFWWYTLKSFCIMKRCLGKTIGYAREKHVGKMLSLLWTELLGCRPGINCICGSTRHSLKLPLNHHVSVQHSTFPSGTERGQRTPMVNPVPPVLQRWLPMGLSIGTEPRFRTARSAASWWV